MRKKYKRYHDFFSKLSVSAGTLSFISSTSYVGTALSGVGLPAGASLGAIGLVCGLLSVLTGEIAKMFLTKLTNMSKQLRFVNQK